ncbi:MAG: AtpZ/AtpI family protein [Stappiaceae bacterium]
MNSASGSGNNGAGKKASPDGELSERLDKLGRNLEEQGRGSPKQHQPSSSSATGGYAQAMKISSEFIAGIIVGGGIGWVFDLWLATKPFGLIVFLLLGFVAGILNVLRATGRVAEPGQPKKPDAGNEK